VKADALQPRHKVSRYAFLAVMLGISTAVFDGIGITVALPTIGREFALSDAATTWVVNAYQLTVIAAMLPLAALGDVVGQKRLYLTGLALLASMALLSALAPSFGWVIAARAVQGLGAACVTCVNLSLIRHIVPPHKLGRAFGFNATVVALAATLGPSLAGAIISIASWQAVFGLTVIVGLCALLVGLFALPNIERGADRFDGVSALFSAAAFGGVLLGLSGLGHSWPHTLVLAFLVAGVAAGILLVNRQRGRTSPLLPLDLLGNPVFALSVGAGVCVFCAQMLTFVSLPFYLQQVLGFSVLEAGMLFAAWPLAIVCMAPLAGMLADRFPPGRLGLVGMLLLAFGLGAMAILPPHPHMADVVWRMMFCGAGFGLFQSPNNRLLIGSVPRSRSAAASGMQGTARLLGQSIGTALATMVLASGIGPAVALMIGVGVSLTGATLSIMRRGNIDVT
jgi:DHA2 family multidrug resistance protein-like MFS transporter